MLLSSNLDVHSSYRNQTSINQHMERNMLQFRPLLPDRRPAAAQETKSPRLNNSPAYTPRKFLKTLAHVLKCMNKHRDNIGFDFLGALKVSGAISMCKAFPDAADMLESSRQPIMYGSHLNHNINNIYTYTSSSCCDRITSRNVAPLAPSVWLFVDVPRRQPIPMSLALEQSTVFCELIETNCNNTRHFEI